MSAHRASIYQVLLKNGDNELVSASEDGDVKIWGNDAVTATSIYSFLQPVCYVYFGLQHDFRSTIKNYDRLYSTAR